MSRWIRPALLTLLAFTLAAPAAADTTLRVFSTASTKAELRDCGCKGKPLGGLAERATLLTKHSVGADATLLVDGGNWAEIKGDIALEKTEFLWDVMADLGYEVTTVGDREMMHGLAPLQKILARHPEIRVVSANITDSADALVWDSHTVLEKSGVRVGITAVTSDAAYRFAKARDRINHDDFKFRDPVAALEEIIPVLAETSDVILVLGQAGAVDAERWTKAYPDIDVMVVSYDPGYAFSPETQGDTIMIRSGSQGKYLGMLDLVVNANGERVSFSGESKPVNSSIEGDPAIESMVTAWEKKHGLYEADVKTTDDVPLAGGKK